MKQKLSNISVCKTKPSSGATRGYIGQCFVSYIFLLYVFRLLCLRFFNCRKDQSFSKFFYFKCFTDPGLLKIRQRQRLVAVVLTVYKLCMTAFLANQKSFLWGNYKNRAYYRNFAVFALHFSKKAKNIKTKSKTKQIKSKNKNTSKASNTIRKYC